MPLIVCVALENCRRERGGVSEEEQNFKKRQLAKGNKKWRKKRLTVFNEAVMFIPGRSLLLGSLQRGREGLGAGWGVGRPSQHASPCEP
ncbi:hypothetical protein E2C01_007409 [Portunus trituberculatus]|uniref:Uncharacterized protein n=1 Tax=Portunus trituberculatus TaxID=210409 RepID=A0A5B7CZ65_PORTR|nr:hypothetical protein [Portunus trituberculatus]